MREAIEQEITFLRDQIRTLRRTANAIENQIDHFETRIDDLRRVAAATGGAAMKPCPCGSGEPREELLDARGIFCSYVCGKCEAARRANFRPDIFTDPNYWADEPIEED